MAKVLTMASTVTCGHEALPKRGTVTKNESPAKLAVAGKAVLLESSVLPATVADCGTTPASDQAGVIAKPCTKVDGVTDGKAKKLTVGGNPVLLETLAGFTDGLLNRIEIQKKVNGTANQSKLQTS
jgi:hypothetical protein